MQLVNSYICHNYAGVSSPVSLLFLLLYTLLIRSPSSISSMCLHNWQIKKHIILLKKKKSHIREMTDKWPQKVQNTHNIVSTNADSTWCDSRWASSTLSSDSMRNLLTYNNAHNFRWLRTMSTYVHKQLIHGTVMSF
jgi:hypothetical protein